jgi:hypothetical protein
MRLESRLSSSQPLAENADMLGFIPAAEFPRATTTRLFSCDELRSSKRTLNPQRK